MNPNFQPIPNNGQPHFQQPFIQPATNQNMNRPASPQHPYPIMMQRPISPNQRMQGNVGSPYVQRPIPMNSNDRNEILTVTNALTNNGTDFQHLNQHDLHNLHQMNASYLQSLMQQRTQQRFPQQQQPPHLQQQQQQQPPQQYQSQPRESGLNRFPARM